MRAWIGLQRVPDREAGHELVRIAPARLEERARRRILMSVSAFSAAIRTRRRDSESARPSASGRVAAGASAASVSKGVGGHVVLLRLDEDGADAHQRLRWRASASAPAVGSSRW